MAFLVGLHGGTCSALASPCPAFRSLACVFRYGLTHLLLLGPIPGCSHDSAQGGHGMYFVQTRPPGTSEALEPG